MRKGNTYLKINLNIIMVNKGDYYDCEDCCCGGGCCCLGHNRPELNEVGEEDIEIQRYESNKNKLNTFDSRISSASIEVSRGD
jgi:acetylornithine/succinyldiaminopimelate/putrescine aminotransferase